MNVQEFGNQVSSGELSRFAIVDHLLDICDSIALVKSIDTTTPGYVGRVRYDIEAKHKDGRVFPERCYMGPENLEACLWSLATNIELGVAFRK